jgi:hypothetical protein
MARRYCNLKPIDVLSMRILDDNKDLHFDQLLVLIWLARSPLKFTAYLSMIQLHSAYMKPKNKKSHTY